MVFAGGHTSALSAVSTAVLVRGRTTSEECAGHVVTQLIAAVLTSHARPRREPRRHGKRSRSTHQQRARAVSGAGTASALAAPASDGPAL